MCKPTDSWGARSYTLLMAFQDDAFQHDAFLRRRTTTTRQVALLWQQYQEGQLLLAPDFQRNSVWPLAAQAYLIDTILEDKPIPPIFLQRASSSRTGRPAYSVVDGQQRLRAVFQFLEGRFRLTQSSGQRRRRTFDRLTERDKEQVVNYDFVVAVLVGYKEEDIDDIFVCSNRYVVK